MIHQEIDEELSTVVGSHLAGTWRALVVDKQKRNTIDAELL